MIEAYIHDAPQGPSLTIVESEDRCREIPLAAIASWSELLGQSDAVDTLDAIIREQDNPNLDQDVWQEAMLLVQNREEAREAEAFRAMEEGTADDPRSPLLRASLAAYKATLAGAERLEDCPLSKCQKVLRDRLGVVDPPRLAPTVRCGAMDCSEAPEGECEKPRALSEEDRAGLAQLCSQAMHMIQDLKGGFCHGLTSFDQDPLGPAPEPTSETLSAEDVLRKYQEAE